MLTNKCLLPTNKKSEQISFISKWSSVTVLLIKLYIENYFSSHFPSIHTLIFLQKWKYKCIHELESCCLLIYTSISKWFGLIEKIVQDSVTHQSLQSKPRTQVWLRHIHFPSTKESFCTVLIFLIFPIFTQHSLRLLKWFFEVNEVI